MNNCLFKHLAVFFFCLYHLRGTETVDMGHDAKIRDEEKEQLPKLPWIAHNLNECLRAKAFFFLPTSRLFKPVRVDWGTQILKTWGLQMQALEGGPGGGEFGKRMEVMQQVVCQLRFPLIMKISLRILFHG